MSGGMIPVCRAGAIKEDPPAVDTEAHSFMRPDRNRSARHSSTNKAEASWGDGHALMRGRLTWMIELPEKDRGGGRHDASLDGTPDAILGHVASWGDRFPMTAAISEEAGLSTTSSARSLSCDRFLIQSTENSAS